MSDKPGSRLPILALCLLTVFAAGAPGLAAAERGGGQDHAAESAKEATAEERHAETAAAGHEEHEFHRHHFSVFLGVTAGEAERPAEVGAESGGGEEVVFADEEVFSMGLDYEYRLSRRWGVGALVDYAGEDYRAWVFGFPLVWHPGGQWKILLAPGFEDAEDHDREFLYRVGVMYDLEVGGFTITPAFNIDVVDDEELLVYGVNIGKGF